MLRYAGAIVASMPATASTVVPGAMSICIRTIGAARRARAMSAGLAVGQIATAALAMISGVGSSGTSL
jgi:hypothetical protein